VVLQQKEAQISELKVKIDELRLSADRETKSREELQHHYQHRLREKCDQLEQYRRSAAPAARFCSFYLHFYV